MRFHGGSALGWSRIERILSGRPHPDLIPAGPPSLTTPPPPTAAPEPPARRAPSIPFAELHAVSSYSFLGGASEPEELVARAVELGLCGLGLLDRDGFYGVVRFAEAAAKAGLPTIIGAELALDSAGGAVLPVICRGPAGYQALCQVLTHAHMVTGTKGQVAYPPLAQLAQRLAGTCLVLANHTWADRLEELVDCFGPQGVVLEYQATMVPEDADHAMALDAARQRCARSGRAGLRAIISAAPAAATRDGVRLAAAKRALACRESVGQAAPRLHPMGAPWLRSGQQVAALAPDRSAEIAQTCEIAAECAFTLNLVAPQLPDCPTPQGYTEMTWLAHLTRTRGQRRYAARSADVQRRAWAQIDYELGVIEELNFPGYFLIVLGIVDFCARENIYCQGRGSAANSAVCFALGITNAEPISAGLLFERFLSPERDGPPDIDLDIESTRREEVIQYVYATYGRDNAAQVANVITYRRKGATRDAARALGYPQGAADSWAQGVHEVPEDVATLAHQFLGQPRHLGIHSGGMVICDRPLARVVPTEWARMKDRSVVQWDKDDCAGAGLVKFDLLGLGMLEALHHMVDLVAQTTGTTIHLWDLDLTEPAVYDMLSRGDAVGVFQVESRAQLATLPRLKPRVFFDLVVEVALIRPGPIQGGSVHPYLRRRDGREPVTYEHPCLEKSLGKTLGIPLFQEQLMQIAVDAAGFSGAEADTLRRAMGSKRSPARMAALRERFFAGLRATHGIEGDTAQALWNKIVAFAAYGFPESHSQSFASLVFFSAWFKLHYPAQFCVGLLRAQPMGFYSPQSLIQDARRHGVDILPVSIAESEEEATVTPGGAIRLGLNLVRGLGAGAARIPAARAAGGPFASMADLARRAELSVEQAEALARAGACDCLGVDRRQALWAAGVAATEKAGMLPGLSQLDAPVLPGMSALEILAADVAATGVTPHAQPMELLRAGLEAAGVIPASGLMGVPDGTRIRIAGVVTHRQRPQTASGVTFFGLEDETGLINVIVSPGLWARQKVLARTARALIIRGKVENASGVAAVVADKLEPLAVGQVLSPGSRDFR
ncbi:error-prone DNA polymerase [uncultured Corynebacterium sp.]|uniref:error-prone DNA polymerase n=1 Tax=uncultured Corynebacterium sp. TaxID=159447 RepID=UPI00288AA357|nr:error-prone DNA polymerase [uncultured Corynebacterium sp.]